MPYGTPRNEEERKERHLEKYGTTEIPEERKGAGTFWKEEKERMKYLSDLLTKVEESEFTRADPEFHSMVKKKLDWLKEKLEEWL